MQVSTTILIIAVEAYAVLLLGAIFLFIHIRKLKTLLNLQQEKLLAILREQQNNKKPPAHAAVPTPPIKPTQNYKSYLNEVLEATSAQYSLTSSGGDIGSEQAVDSPLLQRILALRYAFLRSEELGTTEPIGSAEYWNIFQQALEPLLTSSSNPDQELENELETCKKRIGNLEKFKLLFFDMEKQWSKAQANAENYYQQLTSMVDDIANKQDFNDILQQYHNVYDDIHKSIVQTKVNPDAITTKTTIYITRQDPHATDEIVKLRNVAVEQHRTINQLQQKLMEATTPVEKEAVFQELQHQLQRQIRFVQESETCIQLLEDELAKAHEELSLQANVLDAQSAINEENQHMKDVLYNFSLESKGMISNITELKKENDLLKNTPSNPASATQSPELKKLQTEYIDLKKQYAELEEKYLDLKLQK